jgi:hypothetical protein
VLRAWAVAGVAVLVIACHAPKSPYIAVRGGDVTAKLDELRRDGEARLPTVMVSGKGTQPADLETVFYYQTVTLDGATTTIEALASGPVLPADALIKLRELAGGVPKEPKKSNVPAIAFGALAVASAVGAIYCIAECESKAGLKASGLGLGALVFGLVSYVLAGGTIRD